jgi:putative PIN family toxin of toxin-antitoxin system
LVSAFAFGGKPYESVSRALSEAEIWVSPDLLTEYRQVPIELEAVEKITREQITALVAGIAAFVSEAHLCAPKKPLLICRDPEDNMLLERCLAAHAEVLITGNRDFLEISRTSLRAAGLRRLRILRPASYLRRKKF